MNSTYDTDVLVVGAGPTGLTLAASLVQAGHRDRPSWTGRPRAPTRRARRWSTPAASKCSKGLDVARRLVKEGIAGAACSASATARAP